MKNQAFDTDVLIVGAGPAGTAAALSLLRYSDLTVTLVESSDFNTIRVGEQVNPSIFDLLAYLDIPKNQFEADSFIKGYSNLAAWGSPLLTARESIFSAQEESYQLDREKFDLLLLQEASERGATIFPRSKCLAFNALGDEGWELSLQHQTAGPFSLKTRFLIDATGRQSSICRLLGVASVKYDQLTAVGAFLHFDEMPSIKQDILLETVQEGWWYSATLPQQRMTLTLFSDADLIKEGQWQKSKNWNNLLTETIHTKNKIKTAKSFGQPWVKNAFSQISDFTCRNNFLAVGDAAASFDPISSMGIGFALSTGCHAARALINTELGDNTAIANYQQNIATIFSNYLKVKTTFYQKETRWPAQTFWQRRLVPTAVAAL